METQLAQCLTGSISPDSYVRSQSESSLLQLHADPACGEALCNILLSSQAPLDLRQSAAISLRKWIKERWSALFEGFVGFPPEGKPVQSENKAPVRFALLQALGLPGQEQRRIRVAAAASLTAVCSSDWPDEFPELLPTVHGMLQPDQSGTVSDAARDRVHGALAFLSEFWSSEMDERQILGGAKEMLPTIEAVLGNQQAYPASLRCRCVLIFRQLLSSLFMVREVYPDVSRSIADEVLPRWISALQSMAGSELSQQLASDSSTPEEKHGQLCLVNEVWRTLKIATHFRTQIKPYLTDLLRQSIGLLQQLQGVFAAFYLTEDADPPFTAAEGDSDIQTTLPNLLCSIVDFIAEATRNDRGRPVLVENGQPSSGMTMLTSALISYARVTTEEEEEWTSDANAFVAASDEDGVEYGLRVASADLVQDLLDAYPQAAIQSLAEAVRESSNPARGWRSTEAALAVLGGVAEEIMDFQSGKGKGANLDLESIFSQAVLPSVQRQDAPLLTGRAYIFASQFATALPEDLARQFVEASVQALEADNIGSYEETLIIKLSAVRCIKNFYRQLSSSLLSPFTARIIARLGPLLLQANDDTLVLVLETIQCIVGDGAQSGSGAGPAIAPETYAEVVKATLSVWKEHAKDFILLSVVSDLLESLAGQKSQEVAQAVLNAGQTEVASMIRTAADPRSSEEAELLEPSMTLAESMLSGASAAALEASSTADVLLGPVIAALSGTEDRDVLQSGIGSLTSLVRKSTSAVATWSQSGRPAMDYFLTIISRLLLLDTESGGLRVGEFIIALLRKLPEQVLPVLPDLLNAMIKRLATAETASFTQSLIMPFAYLMNDQAEVVLHLLSSAQCTVPADFATDIDPASPAPASEIQVSGLVVFLVKYFSTAETIQGFWAQRVSLVAMVRLLSLVSSNPAVAEPFDFAVRGDLLPDNSNLIRTRSRAKKMPHRHASIPAIAKILKLLVAEYGSATNGPPVPQGLEYLGGQGGGGDGGEGGVDTDDEDAEWDDEDDFDGGVAAVGSSKRAKEEAYLSDLLSSDHLSGLDASNMDGGGDEGGDDEELREDPVYNMAFRDFLAAFFRDVASRSGGPPSSSSSSGAAATKEDPVRSQAAWLNEGEKNKLEAIIRGGN